MPQVCKYVLRKDAKSSGSGCKKDWKILEGQGEQGENHAVHLQMEWDEA